MFNSSDSIDCSLLEPPGFSDHGISQRGILEWVAISFSRESSWPRDQTCTSCLGQADSLLLNHQGSSCTLIHGIRKDVLLCLAYFAQYFVYEIHSYFECFEFIIWMLEEYSFCLFSWVTFYMNITQLCSFYCWWVWVVLCFLDFMNKIVINIHEYAFLHNKPSFLWDIT